MNILHGQEITSLGSLEVFFLVLVFVLLAEMGDKSQFLVMAFSTKYKLRQVVIGVTLSVIALNALAVFMGSLLTTIIPVKYTQMLASALFIFFGVLAFKKEDDEEDVNKKTKVNPTLTVAISFFIAELGDKTQLATMALAAKYQNPLIVFLAAVIAMLIADMIGIVAGVTLNKYIPQKYIKILAGIVFIGFGLFGLLNLLPAQQFSNVLNTIAILVGVGGIIVIYLLLANSKRL